MKKKEPKNHYSGDLSYLGSGTHGTNPNAIACSNNAQSDAQAHTLMLFP